jgi:hypothetical protein
MKVEYLLEIRYGECNKSGHEWNSSVDKGEYNGVEKKIQESSSRVLSINQLDKADIFSENNNKPIC